MTNDMNTDTKFINTTPASLNEAIASLSVSLEAMGLLGTQVGVLVKMVNTGDTTMSNIRIASANLIGVTAYVISPGGEFNLDARASEAVVLGFSPLTRGQTGSLSLSGTSSAGPFSFSQVVTLP